MLIGNNLGTFIKQEKAKHRVFNNLAFYLVPRPAFEILNMGILKLILLNFIIKHKYLIINDIKGFLYLF